MRKYFEFYIGAKINCGEDALMTLGAELTYFGCKRPLLIISPRAEKCGAVGKIQVALKGSPAEKIAIAESPQNQVDEDNARKIKALYRKNNCDAIIALGGEATLDTAKCVRLLLAQECDEILPIAVVGAAKTAEIPFIAIPTECGSGKESHGEFTVGDKYFSSRALAPNVILLDEKVADAMPRRTIAACGIYALSNAIEAYLGAEEESITEIYAEKAVRLISKHLSTAVSVSDEPEALRGVALAGTLSGIAYGESPFGAAHALAEGLSEITGEAKEEMHCITIVPALKKAAKTQEKRMKNLLLALIGASAYAETPQEERPAKTIAEVANLLETLRQSTDIPTKLSQTKIQREDFGRIAEAAANTRASITTQYPLTKTDFLELLNEAY